MLKEKIGISKVFLACGYTDLRFGVDGLANEIQNVFQLNPFDEVHCSYSVEDHHLV